jgi:anti-anti-sigma factor
MTDDLLSVQAGDTVDGPDRGLTLPIAVVGAILAATRGHLAVRVLDAVTSALPGPHDPPLRVRLDLARCVQIDSAGLQALVSLDKRIRQARATLVIAGLNEDLRNLLALTKLTDVLSIELPAAVARG